MSNPRVVMEVEDESWINRLSRFVSENGPGILSHLPSFPASQGAIIPSDHLPSLTLPASSHFSVQESAAKENAQMTIFYGGQVIVLNLPTNKAEAIIRQATQASSFLPASSSTANPVAPALAVTHMDFTGTSRTHTCGTGNGASGVQANRHADLPIQRKKSLSLFLEKRRNSARAPYHVKGEESCKSADDKPWLALAAPSHNGSET